MLHAVELVGSWESLPVMVVLSLPEDKGTTRTRTQTITNPDETEANAAGRNVRAKATTRRLLGSAMRAGRIIFPTPIEVRFGRRKARRI